MKLPRPGKREALATALTGLSASTIGLAATHETSAVSQQEFESIKQELDQQKAVTDTVTEVFKEARKEDKQTSQQLWRKIYKLSKKLKEQKAKNKELEQALQGEVIEGDKSILATIITLWNSLDEDAFEDNGHTYKSKEELGSKIIEYLTAFREYQTEVKKQKFQTGD